MENKMKEVAKLLGVELEEEFKLKEKDTNYIIHTKYKLTENSLMGWSVPEQKWWYSTMLQHLLTGRYQIVKLPKPILDDIERKYLGNIVKPFRDRIIYIAKAETVKTYSPNAKVYECIYIMYKDSSKKQNPFYMGFPCFKKGTMYKGMELNKEYSLEELGLQVKEL